MKKASCSGYNEFKKEAAMSVKDLIKNEIEKLPESFLLEVYDFIQFLEIKEEKERLIKASEELSRKSFEKVWDNEEDAVYDSL